MTWHQFRIERFEYLVGLVAKKYRWMTLHGRVDTGDLMQAARIGLMTSCRKFDPSKGVRFSTYAVYWMHHEVQQLGAACIYGVYIPQWVYWENRKLGKRMPKTIMLDAYSGDWNRPGEETLKQRIPARDPKPDAPLDERQRDATIQRLLSSIDKRCAEVVWRRANGETLEAIGQSLGITRERARQLHVKGLEQCRQHRLSHSLKAFAEDSP